MRKYNFFIFIYLILEWQIDTGQAYQFKAGVVDVSLGVWEKNISIILFEF